jgi:hypothetical protein
MMLTSPLRKFAFKYSPVGVWFAIIEKTIPMSMLFARDSFSRPEKDLAGWSYVYVRGPLMLYDVERLAW